MSGALHTAIALAASTDAVDGAAGDGHSAAAGDGHDDAAGDGHSAADAQRSTMTPELCERARAIDDTTLSQPIQMALRSLEMALTSFGRGASSGTLEEPQPPEKISDSSTLDADNPAGAAAADGGGDCGPERLRAQFGIAIAMSDDADIMRQLVATVQGCLDGGSGADVLVDRLVELFELSPPTDGEMVTLRRLQERWGESSGMAAYAVASVWLAALFVRTERCLAARSRLTQAVLSMPAEQLRELKQASSFHDLPWPSLNFHSRAAARAQAG